MHVSPLLACKVHEIHKYRNDDAHRGLAKSESGRLNLFSLLKTLFYVCNDRLMRGMQQDSRSNAIRLRKNQYEKWAHVYFISTNSINTFFMTL